MPNKVVQIKSIGSVIFSQNRRSKNIKISVKPDKSVLVSYPTYASSREVLNFLMKNEGWIQHQQSKFEAKKSVFESGSVIHTKLHELTLFKGEKNHALVKDNRVTLFIGDFESEEAVRYIDKILAAVYRNEAKRMLPPRLAELARQFGFRYNNITIRNNKRNWGSCSSKNNISLNLQMMKLPDELIDYILLHELVHTEIKNHGPEFWKRLNGITGNRARQLVKQVKQYSTYTL